MPVRVFSLLRVTAPIITGYDTRLEDDYYILCLEQKDRFCIFVRTAAVTQEYWKRGYEEVTTPNMFNMDLWEQSGHAAHYKDNMFRFGVEGAEFGAL